MIVTLMRTCWGTLNTVVWTHCPCGDSMRYETHVGWLPDPNVPTDCIVTLTGCPAESDGKSTVGGCPRRFTMSTTAPTAATAKRRTVTVTFHARLMTTPVNPG